MFETIIKKMRNLSLAAAVIFIAAGLLIVLFPDEVKDLIGIVVGAAALAVGIYRLAVYFISRKQGDLIAYDLIAGICLAVLGVLCLIRHDQIINYVTVLFGILLLIGGSLKLQHAVDLRHLGAVRWWIFLILAAASIVFSVLIILEPDFMSSVYMQAAGIFLIYDGVTDLAALLTVSVDYHKYKKGTLNQKKPRKNDNQDAYPDDDGYEDDGYPDDDTPEHHSGNAHAAENEKTERYTDDSAYELDSSDPDAGSENKDPFSYEEDD